MVLHFLHSMLLDFDCGILVTFYFLTSLIYIPEFLFQSRPNCIRNFFCGRENIASRKQTCGCSETKSSMRNIQPLARHAWLHRLSDIFFVVDGFQRNAAWCVSRVPPASCVYYAGYMKINAGLSEENVCNKC